MLRRSFLRALAAAPVAAPVIAREATQKAGIPALGCGPSTWVGAMGGAPVPTDQGGYAASRLRELFDPAWERQQRESAARNGVSRLDPDLASARSFSLSAAIRMQRERDVEREIKNSRDYWLREFKNATGMDWLP